MDAWKKCVRSAGKTHFSIKFLVLGGGGLDGQNRQSPIASDFGSRTQIAALFAVLLYQNV